MKVDVHTETKWLLDVDAVETSEFCKSSVFPDNNVKVYPPRERKSEGEKICFQIYEP